MSNQNYKRTISVPANPDEAYWALTEGMHKWWTTPDRTMTKVGDKSKFGFPPGKSYWTFMATTLTPSHLVEMVCVDALHLHEGQPEEIQTEWLGTRVAWTIEPEDTRTNITVEHHGLVPALHCYEICEAGWDFFFAKSLKAFLETGKGQPHRAAS